MLRSELTPCGRVQSKLGMWDFAQFLVTRLAYEDTIREIVQHAAAMPSDQDGHAQAGDAAAIL